MTVSATNADRMSPWQGDLQAKTRGIFGANLSDMNTRIEQVSSFLFNDVILSNAELALGCTYFAARHGQRRKFHYNVNRPALAAMQRPLSFV